MWAVELEKYSIELSFHLAEINGRQRNLVIAFLRLRSTFSVLIVDISTNEHNKNRCVSRLKRVLSVQVITITGASRYTYAAVAANTSAWLAFVRSPRLAAKAVVNPPTMPSFTIGGFTMCRLTIAPTKSIAERMVLMAVTIWWMRFSGKYAMPPHEGGRFRRSSLKKNP